ncbi:FHA domain-containing protein [bacterium]|nr:FHA domain-containing protein [bacterium]
MSDTTNSIAATVKLVITRGGTVGKEFAVETGGETLIGRWDPDGGAFPEVDLTSDDPEAKISRKHARIFIENGEFFVEDLGSLNGTYVNRGPRLLPGSPQALKDGDEIVMGKTFFKFHQA